MRGRKRSQRSGEIIRPDIIEINKVFHKNFTVNARLRNGGKIIDKSGSKDAEELYVFL